MSIQLYPQKIMKIKGDKLKKIILRIGRAIHRRMTKFDDKVFGNEECPVCGVKADLRMRGVLWPELVLQWRLSPAQANWIDQREGLRCVACRSNLRSRHLARTFVSTMNKRLGTDSRSLKALCNESAMATLIVAEINAAGDLHKFLNRLTGLRYSEFGSQDPNIPSEDLERLSYFDQTIDVVLNSDVLEHVPNVENALSEIHRVLKPNGYFIFTVPLIPSQRVSTRRAFVQDGKVIHLLEPSYHGSDKSEKNDFLVFNEFGQDFLDLCKQSGFDVAVLSDVRNPTLITFVAQPL